MTDPGLPADEAANWRAVTQIRREHPRWVTIWVARIGRYRAWPLFRAPPGTTLTARTPDELSAKMDQVEQHSRRPRGRSGAIPAQPEDPAGSAPA